MILKLRYPALLFILSFIFNSCEKEYSLEGDITGPAAVYTFTSSQGTCANVVVTGTYQAGTALGATNLATISVDVTTAGSYAVTTNTTNGISFTGTGAFTTTGTQTIALTGTGVPTATGAFSFTPGTNACSFPVTVSDAGAGASVFTYAGGTGTCTKATPAGNYLVGTALTAANTVAIDVDVTTKGTWSVSTPVVNGFSFSGAGNFTTPGPQSIILTAAGTPTTAGISNFTPTNGCLFPITVLTGTIQTDSLVCTIDGVAKTFNVGLSGELITNDTLSITGQSADAIPILFGINIVKSPEITIGTYDRYLLTNMATFCVAGFTDGTTSWFTGASPTATTGFSVVVTSTANNRIVGTFSGTVYSDPVSGTGARVITDGKFSLPY